MYHFALFFACVGAIAGMLNYIMVDAGGDNWFGTQATNMSIIIVSEDDIQNLVTSDSSGVEAFEDTGRYLSLLWNVVKGILNITSMLDDFLYWDVDGVNVFAPILLLFQGMIYIIYIVGIVQFVMNRSMKSMD
jgi:hypothetical protein